VVKSFIKYCAKFTLDENVVVDLWEHPHDSTVHLLPLSHNIFSSLFFLTAKFLIHAPNQTATTSPLYITATFPLSFYLFITGPFRSSQAKLLTEGGDLHEAEVDVSRKDFHRFAGQHDLNGSSLQVGQVRNGH